MTQKKIELNKEEYSYLTKVQFLPEKIQILSSIEKNVEGLYLLEISEELSDKIRDLCGERLLVVGFDENYEPTREGEILESLVDKFFIG